MKNYSLVFFLGIFDEDGDETAVVLEHSSEYGIGSSIEIVKECMDLNSGLCSFSGAQDVVYNLRNMTHVVIAEIVPEDKKEPGNGNVVTFGR